MGVDGKLMPRQQEEVATGNLFFFSCCYPGTVSEDVGELLRVAKRKGSAEGVRQCQHHCESASGKGNTKTLLRPPKDKAASLKSCQRDEKRR